MSLIGLDIGTTGCKAVAFDENGFEIGKGYVEYPLIHPKPGWAELATDTIWDSVKKVLKEAAGKAGSDKPTALAISCQGEAIAPVDRKGNALYNFSVSFDDRTIPQSKWWEENLGKERIFQITGIPLHPMHSINKIMWFKENRPEIYEKTWKFLCVEDYLIFKLTGAAVISYSLASRTMAFDITSKDWSETILDKAGIDKNLLSESRPSGYLAGEIITSLADELGLSPNLKVVTGGHDQGCGTLGAGVTMAGYAMNATGTSDVICPIMNEANLSSKLLDSNFCCNPHVVDDFYLSIGFNLTGGLLMRWYRDTLCAGEVAQAEKLGCDPYEIIDATSSDKIARPMFLPHFVGSGTPTLDPLSRGALLNLTVDVDKAELNRAVLDSINYEMRFNIETMGEAGIKIERIRAIGGGAKSKRWLQLKADVFGIPVESLEVNEAASLGAAILAGKATGIYKDFSDSLGNIIRIKKIHEPDLKEHKLYENQYQLYKNIYPEMKALNHRFSSISKQ